MRSKVCVPTLDYHALAEAIEGEPLPAALVDLDALDRNIDTLFALLGHGQTLRIASKSVRCPALLRHIIARGGARARGLMSYSARETAFLVQQGFDDLLLAYPCVHTHDLEQLAAANAGPAVARVVVDSAEQLEPLAACARRHQVTIPVVIELDVSYRRLWTRLHVGVRRSPLFAVEDVVALARRISGMAGLAFGGVMAYEAQIAGLTDDNPFARALDRPKRLFKRLSRRDVARRRAALATALAAAGSPPQLFNGGGTGSLRSCASEAALTEVTAGSGFLCSHLFDYYVDLDLEPAALFAVQVVRRPAPNLVTCHGGGYVASGESGRDRLPVPYLPQGLRLLDLEGAGEVQTPLVVPAGLRLELGAPVFFRHAKAGELAEHFNTYLLLRAGRVVGRAPTYRGLGHAFL